MVVLINPGTGPVEDATQEQAQANMQEFLAALGLGEDVQAELAGEEDEGRWPFTVSMGKRTCRVDMPGITGLSDERPLHAQTRLYVDGNSWYWGFAVSVTVNRLTLDPEDE